jgi:hypothetical protein
MWLAAADPLWNVPARKLGVYGAYWVDQSKKSSEQLMAGMGGSRIDILRGHDHKLYYRYWNRETVAAVGELPSDGTPIDAFKMPRAQLKLRVDKLVDAPRPMPLHPPKPFKKEAPASGCTGEALVRLTVDDRSEEFWLVGSNFARQSPLTKHAVLGRDRAVQIMMPRDEIQLGFDVLLKDFQQKFDPGTSQPSHYSSTVDLLERRDGSARTIVDDVYLTMNATIDVLDPKTGRNLRLFQESFSGPLNPGDEEYDGIYPDAELREPRWASVLTVNYDPGRETKYAGCLLIVAGICTMFYMRAYFFKPKLRAQPREASEPAEAELVDA